MNAKRLLEALAAAALLGCGAAHAQTGQQQQIDVTVRPAQSVEERVADEVKEKELRRAAEERLAAEQSARIAGQSPRVLLARARTVYVYSDTSYFEETQLQNELRKRDELEAWRVVIVDGHQGSSVADILVEINRPLFTFTFTYEITDRATGIVLATGKVKAFDGNAAAPKLAARIVEDMEKARGEAGDGKK
ncbi:MAG TPA: hypothetical protein VGB98_21075 [Pyrinomonadaceae bacterium]|jgi:hypothetical protein